jgi:hypothetical protein
MNKIKIIVGLIILVLILIFIIPSIKYLHEIIIYYPQAIEKSKTDEGKKDKNNSEVLFFSLPMSENNLNKDFEESISQILSPKNRRILLRNIVVEILDSSCTTPLCGLIAFAKAVRVRLENGDTLVFVSLCLGDIAKTDEELMAQYSPGEYIQYANDSLPNFAINLSPCTITGDLQKYPYVIAKPIGHP